MEWLEGRLPQYHHSIIVIQQRQRPHRRAGAFAQCLGGQRGTPRSLSTPTSRRPHARVPHALRPCIHQPWSTLCQPRSTNPEVYFVCPHLFVHPQHSLLRNQGLPAHFNDTFPFFMCSIIRCARSCTSRNCSAFPMSSSIRSMYHMRRPIYSISCACCLYSTSVHTASRNSS